MTRMRKIIISLGAAGVLGAAAWLVVPMASSSAAPVPATCSASGAQPACEYVAAGNQQVFTATTTDDWIVTVTHNGTTAVGASGDSSHPNPAGSFATAPGDKVDVLISAYCDPLGGCSIIGSVNASDAVA